MRSSDDSKILTTLKHHRVLQSPPFKHELAHPSMWVQTWPAIEAVPFIVDGLYVLKVIFMSSYHLYLYFYNFHHPLPFGDTKNKFNFCSLWQLAIQLFIYSFKRLLLSSSHMQALRTQRSKKNTKPYSLEYYSLLHWPLVSSL